MTEKTHDQRIQYSTDRGYVRVKPSGFDAEVVVSREVFTAADLVAHRVMTRISGHEFSVGTILGEVLRTFMDLDLLGAATPVEMSKGAEDEEGA